LPAKDPELRRQISRLGALSLHSQVDGKKHTKPARAAFNRRFEVEVDPRGELDLAERARRAEFARQAYFQRLAIASAKARAKKAAS
jgi:hypothetical protein